MKDQITITARIPQALGTDIADIAGALRRPRSWVIEEALREYVAREKSFLEAVDEGIHAEEAGEMVEHTEVVAEMNKIISAARQRKQQ